MKSKIAYKCIDDDAIVMNNGDRMVDASTAYMAVDFAEMETARKAAKAFCFCKCGVGPCIMKQVGREECKDLREFKRKMEDEYGCL